MKITAWLFVLFSLLWSLEQLYDWAILENRNIKSSYITHATIDADLLIHGPCEPLWMIAPDWLDKHIDASSYNLALSHSDFADNLIHLHLYLTKNKPPQWMLLYVTPESMDERYNTFNTYRFAPFIDQDTMIAKVVKDCDPAYYRWSGLPFMKYAYYSNRIHFSTVQGMKHYLTNRQLPFHPTGYVPPVQRDWNYRLANFMEMYPDGVTFEWSEQREKYLRQLIELAQKHKIELYLYESPVLNDAKPHQYNRYEIIDRIRQVAAAYEVPYLLFDDLEMANSRDYFFSTLNTNEKGSKIFTDTLGKYLKTYIVDDEQTIDVLLDE